MLRHLLLTFLLSFLAFANVPYGEIASHNGTSENSFLFTGEQLDKETGNYYLRARYYSPATTRFLSHDTYDGKLIDPLSQNHYLYAGGNPVMYVDPSGHVSMVSVVNSMAIMGTLSGFGTSLINTNRLASGSYMRCWLDCMQKHNPLHPAFTAILGTSGPVPKILLQKIPKAWLKAMNLRVFMLPGSSPFTTLPSALSVMLRQGGSSLLRGYGVGAYYGVLIYGTYMNILQGVCLTKCANNECKD